MLLDNIFFLLLLLNIIIISSRHKKTIYQKSVGNGFNPLLELIHRCQHLFTPGGCAFTNETTKFRHMRYSIGSFLHICSQWIAVAGGRVRVPFRSEIFSPFHYLRSPHNCEDHALKIHLNSLLKYVNFITNKTTDMPVKRTTSCICIKTINK